MCGASLDLVLFRRSNEVALTTLAAEALAMKQMKEGQAVQPERAAAFQESVPLSATVIDVQVFPLIPGNACKESIPSSHLKRPVSQGLGICLSSEG